MTAGEHDPPGIYYEVKVDARMKLTYRNGAWSGTCTWTQTERSTVFDENGEPTGYEWENTSGTVQVNRGPLREDADASIGDRVEVQVFSEHCTYGPLPGMLTVEEIKTHTSPRQSDGSMSYYGYWKPEWPADAYAYWDVDTGLVLAYRDQRSYSYNDGWMVDTNAPLS